MSGPCSECGREPLYRWDCIRCAQLFRRPRHYWERALAKLWMQEREAISPNLILAGEIRRLHALGRTAVEAAGELGMTKDRLNSIRREIGLSPFAQSEHPRGRPSSWKPAETAALVAAIASGVTKGQFAAEIGRTMRAVDNRRRLLKLPPFLNTGSSACRGRRPAWPPSRVETLKQLRAERFSFAECAARLNTTRGSIARSVHKYLKESADA